MEWNKPRKIRTNCPNCGSVIAKDGKCEYCGTLIRIANELDVQMMSGCVDMQINLWDGEKVTIVPFVGRLSSVNIEMQYIVPDVTLNGKSFMTSHPELELTFEGHICDERW